MILIKGAITGVVIISLCIIYLKLTLELGITIERKRVGVLAKSRHLFRNSHRKSCFLTGVVVQIGLILTILLGCIINDALL